MAATTPPARTNEMAEHVPLNDEGRVADAVMVGDHSERRRGHREDHHAVADRGACERDGERRLAHDDRAFVARQDACDEQRRHGRMLARSPGFP
jgi:hypothetical protein